VTVESVASVKIAVIIEFNIIGVVICQHDLEATVLGESSKSLIGV
jgi:hypothetical protein